MANRRCPRLTVVAVIIAVQAAAAIATGAAHAASYIVNTLSDNTTADGLCTLREAMLAANNAPANADCGPGSAGLDQIFVVVPGTIALGGPLPTITDHVTISGHSGGTTLDGNRNDRWLIDMRAFAINPSVEVSLEQLTITNAKAPAGLRSGGTLCLPPDNGQDGGAIYNRGQLRLVDVRITHSAAGQGAAGECSSHGTGGRGGAIYNAGSLTGYRVTFDGNSGGSGGRSSTRCCGAGGSGGAIYNAAGASLALFAATFTGNAQGTGTALIGLAEGAALYNDGSARIYSSTFAGNGYPGATNTAAIVAGTGTVELSTTIVADARGCRKVGSGGFADRGYNLSVPGAACGFTPALQSITDWSGPVLETELKNNGGAVPTLALVSTSPAIDRVPLSFEDCAAGVIAVFTDARRIERPQNGNCDIGAYEFGPTFRRSLRALTITGAGSGHGTVSTDGLDCAIAAGTAAGRCSAEFARGAVVTATATPAAGSIFVGWEGDPECEDGSVLMDGDKHCTATFDLRGSSATGSASRVGEIPRAGSAGSAQVKLSARFSFAGIVDLASATLTVEVLLREEDAPDEGDLVPGLPVVLRPRAGSRSTAAIFETPLGATPTFKIDVQVKQPTQSTVTIAVDRATLPRFPTLCATGSRPTTMLTTRFTIDDGIHAPVSVTTREPWRCLDPTGPDQLPRSLRTP